MVKHILYEGQTNEHGTKSWTLILLCMLTCIKSGMYELLLYGNEFDVYKSYLRQRDMKGANFQYSTSTNF